MSPPRPGRFSLLAALAVVFALPASAHAATVSISGSTLHYDAAPGETNEPQVFRELKSGTEIFRISDGNGTALTPGAGCSAGIASTIKCTDTGVTLIEISLLDGADTFDASGTGGLTIPVHVSGGDGNDDLQAVSPARDVVDGGPDDDTISSFDSGGPDEFSGGGGTDTIRIGGVESQTVSLNDVADDGMAGQHANVHADFEAVQTGQGDDTITGTPGPDRLEAGAGSNVIHGEGGDDTLIAGGIGSCLKTDELDGGPGADHVTTNQPGVADGGDGDDTIVASLGCGGLTITGGADTDELDLGSIGGDVVSLDDVANDGNSFAGEYSDDVGGDIETVRGGSGDDNLVGNDLGQTLDGGDGDDVLDGGGGADQLLGGSGYDLVDYSSRTAPLTVDLDGQPGDDGEVGEGDTVGADVEDIWGGSGDDTLTGNDADNWINGGLGADRITGLGGDFDTVDYSDRTAPVTVDLDGQAGDDGQAGEGDTVAADVEQVYGGAGNDTLTGNDAENYLDGGAGADTIDGGGGADWLVGGIGNDRIVSRDAFADDVTCGGDTDSVSADTEDFIDPDCETVSLPGSGGSSSTSSPPSSSSIPVPPPAPRPAHPAPVHTTVPSARPIVAPKDTVAPNATLAGASRLSLASLLRRGASTSVTCSEACSVRAELRLSPATAKRLRLPIVLATASTSMAQPGTVRVVLRPAAKLRRTISRRHLRSLKLTVSAVVNDAARNFRRVSRPLALHR